MAVVLQKHQLLAISKMHNGCVLKGGVGTGKTPTSLGYYWMHILGGQLNRWSSVSSESAVDLYIFTTAHKRDTKDWQIWASRFGLAEDNPQESVAGIRFIVDSYNNMPKYKTVKGAFIICDEQRLVGSGLWAKTFQLMAKHNDWIMLSATPADKWEDYIPLFIANGFYKNRTEFVREHCVYSYFGSYPKLERYMGINKLVKLKHSILVEMPYERHTIRHIHEVHVNYDKETYALVEEKMWNPYEERPLKDAAERFAMRRKVVNSDSSRIEALRSLTQKHPRLIVYYNFNYELEMLRSLAASLTSPASSTSSSATDAASSVRVLSSTDSTSRNTASTATRTSETSGVKIAEWNGQKHEEVPASDQWLYLVQYAAGAEAWNCTATDAMAFFSLTYSYRFFEQSQGRIDRLDTPFTHLNYYILMSKSPLDHGIKRALINKEDFNDVNFKG